MKTFKQILEDSGTAAMLGGHGMQALKDIRAQKRDDNPTSSKHHMRFREYLDDLRKKNPRKI